MNTQIHTNKHGLITTANFLRFVTLRNSDLHTDGDGTVIARPIFIINSDGSEWDFEPGELVEDVFARFGTEAEIETELPSIHGRYVFRDHSSLLDVDGTWEVEG